MQKRANNLVTPEHLGQRVTFQFELPNGFLSEAVGVFERWDEGAQTYFVRKKDGTEVRVPERAVMHGKVIPAQPTGPGTRAPGLATGPDTTSPLSSDTETSE